MEPFGYDPLEAALTENADVSAEEIKSRLLERLEALRKGQAYSDDVTLVVAKILG